MGRPSKANPNGEQIKPSREEANKSGKIGKLIDALKGGLNRDTAISFSGLSRGNVYQRIKDDEIFHTQIVDAEEYRFAIVENEKNKKIKAGFWPAIEKELKSKRASIYGDKVDVDQKTTHIGEIVVKLPD